MNEYGHPLLPLVSPDPYPRVNWEDEEDVGDAGGSRSTCSLLTSPTENRNESVASRASTASRISPSKNTTRAFSDNHQRAGPGKSTGDAGKRTSFQVRIRNWHWKFEIISLLLSIYALVAIIVLLAVEDGSPSESWQFYFSLNTIISVLGTISRSSLASAVGSCLAQEKWNWFRRRQDHLYMFDRIDNASRGSLGSFKLLFWMRSW